MTIKYSPHFEKRLKKRLIKTPSLKKKIVKQIKLLQQNIRHPSLKTHKLKGKRTEEYSCWVEGDLRITFLIIEKTIYLTDIINHDKY